MTGCGKSRRGWSTPSPLSSTTAIAACCNPASPFTISRLRLAIDDRMTIIEAETTMRVDALSHLHRSRADIAASGRRAHRQGMARTGAAEDRPARNLHASGGAARPGGNGAVSDHVPRQVARAAATPWMISAAAASGRSSSAAVTPGEPTAPSSPRCFRNLRPSLRQRLSAVGWSFSKPSEPLQIRRAPRSDWRREYPTDIRLPGRRPSAAPAARSPRRCGGIRRW